MITIHNIYEIMLNMYNYSVDIYYNHCLWCSLGWTGVLVVCGECYNDSVNL